MNTTSNRRRDERLNKQLPVFVRSQNAEGQRLKFSTTTDNISQGGMFLHLPDVLLPGSLLFAFIRLPSQAGMAIIGRIVRTEDKGMSMIGLGIQFNQIRLFANG